MAALTDATAVTGELLKLTRELRGRLNGAAPDFKALAFLADGIAERADVLASTFDEIDKVLAGAPFNHSASDSAAAPAAPQAEAQPSEADAQTSPEQRRLWLTTLLRPARWLARRLRNAWQIFGSRAPSERPELA